MNTSDQPMTVAYTRCNTRACSVTAWLSFTIHGGYNRAGARRSSLSTVPSHVTHRI